MRVGKMQVLKKVGIYYFCSMKRILSTEERRESGYISIVEIRERDRSKVSLEKMRIKVRQQIKVGDYYEDGEKMYVRENYKFIRGIWSK